ncbi:2-C-methyl-D-erythritol 4-phosphate cytidylyltransferase [Colwellia sp. MEBiC06753]
MQSPLTAVTAIVPAAGVGKRMQSACPKQYLSLLGQTVLEHTVNKLLASDYIERVVVAISHEDEYYAQTSLANHPQVVTVFGGKERVDSVYAGLALCQPNSWVLVHDAARPCVLVADIERLITQCQTNNIGGLLAAKVKDTMKRGFVNKVTQDNHVQQTVAREQLWHALTPQMYRAGELAQAIESGLKHGVNITDESSAIEAIGLPSMLVESSSDNIKITQPEDLALAEFILSKQQEIS